MRRRALFCISAFLFAVAPSTASAHFYIDYPDAGYYAGPSPVPWWHEDSLGLPQKLGPCGDEDVATDAGGGPTYVITPFVGGQTITLQWTEVISHTGWFRIALAANRSDFVNPPVQIAANGNSADAGIEDPPVAPVLADGVYKHTIGAAKTWPPYQLTLPNISCAKCTIQIIQVMLDHPSNLGVLPGGGPNPDGFLYHHCIDISIAATGLDAGLTSGGSTSGGSTTGGGSTSGGSTSSGSTTGGSGLDSGASLPESDSGSSGATSGGTAASGCGCALATAHPWTYAVLGLVGLAGLLSRRAVRRRSS
jgi:MYXO-CTERM domain-containing protein